MVETTDEALPSLPEETLREARYIIGQPPLTPDLLARMDSLRCIFNVESNLLPNMPYEEAFARGIHVVTTGAVFAEPVAEIGLGFALSLARNIHGADADFRRGEEHWGGEGNAGRAPPHRLHHRHPGPGHARAGAWRGSSRASGPGSSPTTPGRRPSVTRALGAEPVDLDTLLAESETLFVTAAVTSENQGFLGAEAFARMRPGAALILLSRAGVVDFDALMEAVRSGHIQAASDVFPEEPLPLDHPVRSPPGLPPLRAPRRRARPRLQADGRDGAGGHGPARPGPAAPGLQAGRARDGGAVPLEAGRRELGAAATGAGRRPAARSGSVRRSRRTHAPGPPDHGSQTKGP